MKTATPNTKSTTFIAKKKQRGFTMIELGIVVGIIGMMTALIWSPAANAYANFRASKITNELNNAIPDIQKSFVNNSSFSDLTTETVAFNRWVSDSFLEMNAGVPTGVVRSQWGAITFVPIANNTQIEGTLNGIPSRECLKIAEGMSYKMYLTVSVNGASVKAENMDISQATLGRQCSGNITNIITFTFGRA